MLRRIDVFISILFLALIVGIGSWALMQTGDIREADPKACEEAAVRQLQEDLSTVAAYQQILTQAVQELYQQVEAMRQQMHADGDRK